jgi:alpha-1,3-glucosyltransferase
MYVASSPIRLYINNALADTQVSGSSLPINDEGVTSTSRGLVGDTVFAVIPNVKPIHTFQITVAFQLVNYCYAPKVPLLTVLYQIFLAKLWWTPSYKSFVTALTLCGYSSFMFGWHVHEKAILLVLVPLRYSLLLMPFTS